MAICSRRRIGVCVLTRGYDRLDAYDVLCVRNDRIRKWLEKVHSDVKSKYDFDIVVFHEGNILEGHREYIQSMTPDLPLIFRDVRHEFEMEAGSGSDTCLYCKPTPESERFPVGYKHMCRFWFSRFLKHTRDYDIVIRIDEDCWIEPFDLHRVLEHMRASGCVYVTPRWVGADDPSVTDGLIAVCDAFARDHGLPAPSYDRNPYTSVFIMDAAYFRENRIVQAFFRRIEETGCIYRNRWGDLPLWGVLLSCMGLHEQERCCEELALRYLHFSHWHKINTD